ncbi:AMP-binding protein [Brevibacterium sp. 5221]|uniref:AMP-binding protein n=1 Tax=Brevibacterium rongguiense TaxID=2695267 RepID=A0A6N9H8S8_9MICO|nr:class I adenylate-forming enzyme family protein [Brevibacterium rongguiense]MYM20156.1 AMP-binding protein [Brevibacterium rongguiense]
MPITGRILDLAHEHPDQPAIVAPGPGGTARTISYGELVADSRHTMGTVRALLADLEAQTQPAPASAPEAQGLPIVATSLDSAFDAARIFAGLAGYPVVSATIDPRWPLEHQVGVIAATGIAVVVSDSAALAAVLRERGWTGAIVTGARFAELGRASAPAPAPTRREGPEPFLMLFSSGTTDNPKAFIKTRYQYRENFAVSSAYLEPLPGVHTLAPGPVSYSLTLYALVECLASGGTAHLADGLDAAGLGARIRSEAITRVVAVPALVQALIVAARRTPEDFAGLDLVVTGGANLPAALRDGLAAALPGVRIVSYYGAAEIGFIGDSRGGDGTLISLYTGIEAQVRDSEGAPLPPGELGTLFIRARACSAGYVTGTARARLRGPDGWASVGDQARLVAVDAAEAGAAAVGGGDGPAGAESGARAPKAPRISLAGRAGDIVVTGGHKVALPEVERAFDGMPGLGAGCAIGLPSDSLGTLVAYAVEGPVGSVPAKAELRAWAEPRLAPQFAPRRYYRVGRLPRTVGGKIRREEAARLLALAGNEADPPGAAEAGAARGSRPEASAVESLGGVERL